MNFIPFSSFGKHPSEDEAKLAAQLRRVAEEVERGEVEQLVITLIRPDGHIERLGNVPSLTKNL